MTVQRMGKGITNSAMVHLTKENSVLINFMVRVHLLGQIIKHMMVIGSTTKWKDKELLHGAMGGRA